MAIAPVGTARLGEILIEQGVITEEQLQDALESQRATSQFLGSLLIDLGYATPQQIGKALEAQLGIQFVELSDFELDLGALEALPERLIRRYRAIPLRIEGDVLHVAMADPLDLFAINEMRLTSACKLRPYLATERDVEDAITRMSDARASARQAIAELSAETQEEGEPSTDVLEQMIEDSPIVRLVDSIVAGATDAGASDIHLEPGPDAMRVRYRVDGLLQEAMTVPSHLKAAVVSRVKILAGMDIAERRRPQDGHIVLRVRDVKYDLRVSTVRTVHGEKAVLRLLDSRRMLMPVTALGLNEEQLATVTKMAKRPHGIILVTGPTGSGKSTMLYAILHSMTDPTENVVTIEDPVEYALPGVNQIQVNPKAGVTFAEGLRCILRQDPNVIMVGEIRDRETAEIAVRSAMTGHLVFSTLHTNEAAGAVTRLMDMGVAPFLISSSLLGVVATRLIRLCCPMCSRNSHGDNGGQPVTTCGHCGGSGFKGRTGVFEVMECTDEIRRLILARADTPDIRDAALADGMISMEQAGREKVAAGLTTMAEIARVLDVDA
ncbi:MAG: GspE/PulE family protein [Armatimonadota bacterium]